MGEEDIAKIEKRLNHLEYDDIKQLKEESNSIKLDLTKNNLLTQQSIDSNNKLSDTMESLKSTMVEITQSMKDTNRLTSELAETVLNLNKQVSDIEDKMSDKFGEIDTKINAVNEKSKIDILTFLSKNWLPAFLSIGGIVYIIAYIIRTFAFQH